ncbi:MAG: hypothetical protein IJU50_03140, partial [Lachnospiraceae bacterium]|nr:hypothetical protein [Lachnospiraceae bacterium]
MMGSFQKKPHKESFRSRLSASVLLIALAVVVCLGAVVSSKPQAALAAYSDPETVERERIESGGMIRYKYYVEMNEIPNTYLFIGTYLISTKAITEEYYQLAMKSQQQHNQNNYFYKSELSQGAWKDIKDGGSLERLEASSASVAPGDINDLWISHVIGDDGSIRDPFSGESKDAYGDAHDLMNLTELKPLKSQYDMLNSSAGQSAAVGGNGASGQGAAAGGNGAFGLGAAAGGNGAFGQGAAANRAAVENQHTLLTRMALIKPEGEYQKIFPDMGHNEITDRADATKEKLRENYYEPLLERGEKVEERQKSVERFFATETLSFESNIQFGEGGAGTFSDGKLNTNLHNEFIPVVLGEFVRAGAPKEIKYLSKPHVGTDNLRTVVRTLRKRIESLGGEILYSTRTTDILTCAGKIVGVVTTAGKIDTDAVFLAIGHSARDTFEMLYSRNVAMASKIYSMGVRIEHLKESIDRAQYGKFAPILGAADYKMATPTETGRSLYTFCMCPGGRVVNASSEEGGVCV